VAAFAAMICRSLFHALFNRSPANNLTPTLTYGDGYGYGYEQ
jgi:hypothetical protein